MAQQEDTVDGAPPPEPVLPCHALLRCLRTDADYRVYVVFLILLMTGVMLYGLTAMFDIAFQTGAGGSTWRSTGIGLGISLGILCGSAACVYGSRWVYNSETRRQDAWRLRAQADLEGGGEAAGRP